MFNNSVHPSLNTIHFDAIDNSPRPGKFTRTKTDPGKLHGSEHYKSHNG